jgi:hypothetical protein
MQENNARYTAFDHEELARASIVGAVLGWTYSFWWWIYSGWTKEVGSVVK